VTVRPVSAARAYDACSSPSTNHTVLPPSLRACTPVRLAIMSTISSPRPVVATRP
jgi:hypothetical protein